MTLRWSADNNWYETWSADNEDGYFEIKEVPCGEELEFRVWHESSGWVRKGVSERVEFGKKGFKVTMTADVDLGTVQVNPAAFD